MWGNPRSGLSSTIQLSFAPIGRCRARKPKAQLSALTSMANLWRSELGRVMITPCFA